MKRDCQCECSDLAKYLSSIIQFGRTTILDFRQVVKAKNDSVSNINYQVKHKKKATILGKQVIKTGKY